MPTKQQLQAIVAKLDKTMDDVPVVPGMRVWKRSPWGNLRSFPVAMDCYHDVTKCYSSEAAVEAAERKAARDARNKRRTAQ